MSLCPSGCPGCGCHHPDPCVEGHAEHSDKIEGAWVPATEWHSACSQTPPQTSKQERNKHVLFKLLLFWIFRHLHLNLILIHLPSLVNFLAWFNYHVQSRPGPPLYAHMPPVGFLGGEFVTVCEEIINWLVSTSPCRLEVLHGGWMSVCAPSYPSIQPQPAHVGWGDNNCVSKAEWRFSRGSHRTDRMGRGHINKDLCADT